MLMLVVLLIRLPPLPPIITPTILYNLIFLAGSREDNLHIAGIIHHVVNPIIIAMVAVIDIAVAVGVANLLLFLQPELILS